MRWVMGLAVIVLLAGCASKEPKPNPLLITPNSRLIYHDGQGHAIWTMCDRGNRVYLSHNGPVQVIQGGCPDGAP